MNNLTVLGIAQNKISAQRAIESLADSFPHRQIYTITSTNQIVTENIPDNDTEAVELTAMKYHLIGELMKNELRIV